MRIRNNNPLDLEATEGDRLTLLIHAGAQNAVVNFRTPEGSGVWAAPHQFSVPALAPGVTDCSVRVNVVFKTNAGSECEVRLRDANGEVAPHTFTQTGGVLSDTVRYSIDIRPKAAGGGHA